MAREAIIQYLKEKQLKLSVLATCGDDRKPSCAVMGYAIHDDLTIILSTHKGTRKVRNILQNPKVAVTIGWSFTEMNVQIEGIANVITEGEAYTKADEFFFSQNPNAKQFKTPDTVFIEVKPTWVRLLDFSSQPPKTEEITL